MTKKAPGRTFLMVVGIFLIIGSVSSIITSAMNFVMMGQEEFMPILEQTLQQAGITKTTFQVTIVLTAIPVSYTHLTLPTIYPKCRSRWSPYH